MPVRGEWTMTFLYGSQQRIVLTAVPAASGLLI